MDSKGGNAMRIKDIIDIVCDKPLERSINIIGVSERRFNELTFMYHVKKRSLYSGNNCEFIFVDSVGNIFGLTRIEKRKPDLVWEKILDLKPNYYIALNETHIKAKNDPFHNAYHPIYLKAIKSSKLVEKPVSKYPRIVLLKF